MHSPARDKHNETRHLIERALGVWVDRHAGGKLRSEKALCAFTRNDYEPDIVWFSPRKSCLHHPGHRPFHPVPDFIVEITSPGTEKKTDRGLKATDYAAHGVPEYWIVNPDERVIEQHLLEEDADSYPPPPQIHRRRNHPPPPSPASPSPSPPASTPQANLDLIQSLLG